MCFVFLRAINFSCFQTEFLLLLYLALDLIRMGIFYSVAIKINNQFWAFVILHQFDSMGYCACVCDTASISWPIYFSLLFEPHFFSYAYIPILENNVKV